MIDLHRTQVDGVTVVWTEAAPPLRAGLLFRTGRVDESLQTSGHTHLIEHAALTALGGDSRRHNGYVGGIVTGFLTIGTETDVARFMSDVCTHLTSLPEDRLETEKQIIAAERAARSYDLIGDLLLWRYGAAGYGLAGMKEVGSGGATITQLRELAARGFTRGNAVLWMTGPPPEGLRFDLPEGGRRPIPSLDPVPRPHPSWFLADASGGIASGSVVPRVPAATLFCEIASRRLSAALRTEQAISYSPAVLYDGLDADTAHLILYADSDKARRKELAQAFGAVFDGFDLIADSEIETARADLVERMTGSLAPAPDEMAAAEAQRAAMDWLFGRDFQTIPELAAELSSVTSSNMSNFVRDLKESVLFAMPSAATIRPWIGERAKETTDTVVEGRETPSVDAPVKRERLVHGPDGISVRWPDGSHRTIRYSNLAAALRYPDGGICLVGLDAGAVTVEPTLWRNGAQVCQDIGGRVPEHLLVEETARDARSIPKPSTTRWQRVSASSATILGWSLIALSIAGGAAMLAALVPLALSMSDLSDGPALVAAPVLMVVLPLILPGTLLYVGVRFLQDARKP